MPTLPGSRGSSVFGALVSVSWIRISRGTGPEASRPVTEASRRPSRRRHSPDVDRNYCGQRQESAGSSADPLDRRRGHAGDALAPAYEAHSLVGPELHADLVAVEARCRCDLLAHPVAVGAEARRLANDGRVDGADRVAALRELVAHARQQVDAPGVLPLRVRVWEVV